MTPNGACLKTRHLYFGVILDTMFYDNKEAWFTSQAIMYLLAIISEAINCTTTFGIVTVIFITCLLLVTS